VTPGRIVVTIDRGDYWQCAFVVHKGGGDALRARGVEHFRREVALAAPMLALHVAHIAAMDDVKLLSVSVDRLTRWSRPGLLCIGDAAHAMSPVGGVGINLAVQDAVAAANLLWRPLGERAVSDDDLDAVRRRRLWPVRATQALQVAMQDNVLAPVIAGGASAPIEPPAPMRILTAVPALQRVLARLIGMGVRPEHVESPAA
jgi:2-polyprenyl-6-methoxyphenol hydroxylase-like FAD-dependent oxidoreductase